MAAFVVRPSRPGSIVAAAYALKAQADKADKKAAKKPAEPEPKTAKPQRKARAK
jgi:hypothetical protein